MAAHSSRLAHIIESVSDFVDHVMNWKRDGATPIAFRGESFTQWLTQPKVFRKDVGIYDQEKNSVRDLISIHPQEFKDDQTMFDRLVRMQHFGLPTRLLDVTTNPLVALYFASAPHIENRKNQDGKIQALFLPEARQRYFDSDRVSCMANLANLTVNEKKEMAQAYDVENIHAFNNHPIVKRLISFVRIEKPHFEANIDPKDLVQPVFVKPKMSNRRIIAQSGAFLLYGARQPSSKYQDSDLRLLKAILPARNKEKILKQLELLGIHASSLFPEIEHASMHVVKKYQSILKSSRN